MKSTRSIACLIAVCLLAGCAADGDRGSRDAAALYEPSWASLAAYEAAPAWFKDAKFGIYVHWGVLSVPAFANDWYPRNMHVVGSREHRHQVATYGPLTAFGYHDFVPMFKAEHFDADAWATLFRQAGARFAGLVAEHHDGFSMWNSDVNPWNAADKAPQADLVGALEQAIHGRDMRFVTTFHMARNLQLYADRPASQTDSSYFPYAEGMATSSTDPELRILYGNIPPEAFYENWLAKLKEVIDRYRPDLIYFDGMLGKLPEAYKLDFLAYYLNSAHRWGREVVVTHKNGELPETVSVPDYEKGRMDEITPEPWLTDETVSTGSWSYTDDLRLKPAREILHVLIDVVSKNSVLMLNVSPRADGIIPQDQQDVLRALGDWLGAYGEAIYETRPWRVYGEGPTKLEKGGHFLPRYTYTPQDIRYTTKGDTLYAIALGWPGANRKVLLTALAKARVPGVHIVDVSMLGTSEDLAWTWRDDGLAVTTPAEPVGAMAVVFKILTTGPEDA
jgi:alpha-L-fucosidase